VNVSVIAVVETLMKLLLCSVESTVEEFGSFVCVYVSLPSCLTISGTISFITAKCSVKISLKHVSEDCRHTHVFTRESSYCFQRVLAIAILSVRLSVRHTGGSGKNGPS